MTPASVETRLGTLEFTDGFPSDETAAKVFDHLDFSRAVEVLYGPLEPWCNKTWVPNDIERP